MGNGYSRALEYLVLEYSFAILFMMMYYFFLFILNDFHVFYELFFNKAILKQKNIFFNQKIVETK